MKEFIKVNAGWGDLRKNVLVDVSKIVAYEPDVQGDFTNIYTFFDEFDVKGEITEFDFSNFLKFTDIYGNRVLINGKYIESFNEYKLLQHEKVDDEDECTVICCGKHEFQVKDSSDDVLKQLNAKVIPKAKKVVIIEK